MIGESLHLFATCVSQGKEWPVDGRVYCGALVNNNTNKAMYLLKLLPALRDCSLSKLPEDPIDRYCFVSASCRCDGGIQKGKGYYKPCNDMRTDIRRRCLISINRRESDCVVGKRVEIQRSWKEDVHVNEHAISAFLCWRPNKQQEKWSKKLPEQALDPKLCKALGVNDTNDMLLDEGVQAAVQEKIDEYFKDACLYLRSCLLL